MELGSKFRANSILPEPSHYAFVLSPLLFIALERFFFRSRKTQLLTIWQSGFVIIGFLISLSSSGFILLIVCMILLGTSKFIAIRIWILAIVLFFGLNFLYYNNDNFKTRVDNSFGLIFSDNKTDVNQSDFSSFTLYNNFIIAYTNFLNHPFIGSGLGSHSLAYEKYSITRHDRSLSENLSSTELNTDDANSLFLRIMSELGSFGLILLFIFLFKNYSAKINTEFDLLWIINKASLVLIIGALLRNGHYFLMGLPLFILLYYYTCADKSNSSIRKDINK